MVCKRTSQGGVRRPIQQYSEAILFSYVALISFCTIKSLRASPKILLSVLAIA